MGKVQIPIYLDNMIMNQSNYIPYLKIILSCCLLFPLTLVTPPLSWVRWIFWERSTPSPSNCS